MNGEIKEFFVLLMPYGIPRPSKISDLRQLTSELSKK